MNIFDPILILVIVLGLLRGFRIGFVRQLGSTVGLLAGIGISAWLSAMLVPHLHGTASKTATSFTVLVLSIIICMLAGEVLANRLKASTEKKWAHRIDNGAGAVISSLTLLLIAWIASSLWLLGPPSSWQNAIQGSTIHSKLSSSLPEPTLILKRANELIENKADTKVFSGTEPSPDFNYPAPDIQEFNDVRAKSRQATTKIIGFGCGGIATGTGFFIDKTHVVTNAHVVSGLAYPKVIDSTGRLHNSSVVVFSPKDDLAVLRLSEPAEITPLKLDLSTQKLGSSVLIPGHPGGGNFTEKTGVIASRVNALGKDIYGQSKTVRKVLSLQSKIVQGNSGGAIINKNGNVVGVVFATSTTYNNVGYALANEQVARDILRAPSAKPLKIPSICSQE